MAEKPRVQADPELVFWSTGLKVGLPLAGIASLYLLARRGDMLALAILVVVGTVALIGLGVFVTLAILDRLRRAEELRFSQNMQENIVLLNQMQRVQGAQAQSLLTENSKLRQMLPDPNTLRLKELDPSLSWDVYDEEQAGRKWGSGG